jgi:hypothetical protein
MAPNMRVGGRMISVAVAAELVFQLCGCNLSSPQTNELNAGSRAPTLNKWINLTNGEAIGWVLFLCWLDESLWPALGGGIAGLSMWLKYRYAINAGMKNAEPGTESYT